MKVIRIMGNGSWTRLECEECHREVYGVVSLDTKNSDEYGPAAYCFQCLSTAAGLL